MPAHLKGFACGRLTRKIPLSQGFSSFKTVHRTVLKFTFFGAPSGLGGFRRLRTATIGASRPPRPPRQRLARRCIPRFLIFSHVARVLLTGAFQLFGSETNWEVVEDNFSEIGEADFPHPNSPLPLSRGTVHSPFRGAQFHKAPAFTAYPRAKLPAFAA